MFKIIINNNQLHCKLYNTQNNNNNNLFVTDTKPIFQ